MMIVCMCINHDSSMVEHSLLARVSVQLWLVVNLYDVHIVYVRVYMCMLKCVYRRVRS